MIFDGLKVPLDGGAVDDHLDNLDRFIGSGYFTTDGDSLAYDPSGLRTAMQPVLFASVVPRIWMIDEDRYPVIV